MFRLNEAGILTALIEKPAFIDELGTDLTTEFFKKAGHKTLISTLFAMREDGEEITLVSLDQRLNRDNAPIEKLGWDEIVAEIGSGHLAGITADNIRESMRLIRQSRLDDELGPRCAKFQAERGNGGADRSLIYEWADRARELEARKRTGAPEFLALSQVEAREVHWLVPNFFPLGMVSLISGPGGVGKGHVLLDLFSCISLGLTWPFRERGGIQGNTLYISLEDTPAEVCKPRILRLGGDPNKIFVIPLPRIDLSNPENTRHLETIIAQIGDVKAIALDPVEKFCGRRNQDSMGDVQELADPLQRIAEKQGPAIIMVRHFNKNVGVPSGYRTNGSMGWQDVSRAAFSIFFDRDDPIKRPGQRRFINPEKANLSKNYPGQIAFHIIEDGPLVYQRMEEAISPEYHLGFDKPDETGALQEAKTFLKELLKDGRIGAKEVSKEAEAAGIKDHTLRRAREQLGIVPNKIGGTGGIWYLSLPSPK